MKRKLIFVVNVDWFFISHRLPIALEAVKDYEVHIATGITNHKEELEGYGFTIHSLEISRGTSSIFSSLRNLIEIYKIFNIVKPDIAHLVTIKPVLLGGIAARFARVNCVVSSVSGMGYVFIKRGVLTILTRMAVSFLYRVAFGHKHLRVIFHNKTDLEEVSKLANLLPRESVLIKGSGVNLKEFKFSPIPQGIPIVVLASRMLVDKGVKEFVEAANYLKEKGLKARFVLVGEPDIENNASLSEKEIRGWKERNIIEYWGHRPDMNKVLSQASIVVLPSYREGMPKILLEAAASGRPIVTTDVPGCRDAITPGITGLLVPERNSIALGKEIKYLLDNPKICKSMGCEGRMLAEKFYDIRTVINKHMDIYSELIQEA